MAKKPGLHLGYEWNPKTGHIGKPVTFDLPMLHFVVIGPTRCGKTSALTIPNTLQRKLRAAGRRKAKVRSAEP